MFERFTDRARRLVVNAQEVSKEMGHNYIGTEHLLLGGLRDEDSELTKVLYALGASLPVVGLHLVSHFENVPTFKESPAHVPFTPRAKKALEMALRESLSIGANYISPEHILLGILRDESSEASKLLLELDVNHGAVLRWLTHPEPSPKQSATAGDGRVRVTQDGTIITVTIKADAHIEMQGHAFGGEAYILRSSDEHVITIELAEQDDPSATDTELVQRFSAPDKPAD